MPDVVPNATYHDATLQLECTCTDVIDAGGWPSVVLSYETLGVEATIPLSTFTKTDSISLTKIPSSGDE